MGNWVTPRRMVVGGLAVVAGVAATSVALMVSGGWGLIALEAAGLGLAGLLVLRAEKREPTAGADEEPLPLRMNPEDGGGAEDA